MKKMIGISIAGALILCGCQVMDGDDMVNTNTDIFTEEKQPESDSESAHETAYTAGETVSNIPADLPEFHEDSIITLTEKQADHNALWYSRTGELNKNCVINGSDITVSWEGENGCIYSVRLTGGEIDFSDTTEKTSYTFADVPENKLCSVYVYDMTEDEVYGSYVCSFSIMLTNIDECGEINLAYDDDEKYIFTWDSVSGAEFYAVFLNGSFYKAVTSPQVTFTDFCAGAYETLTVIPSAFDSDGEIVCGKSAELWFVPEKSGNIASADYKKINRKVESGGKVIYTSDISYPVISYADSGISDSINKIISECLLDIKSDEEITAEYEDMGKYSRGTPSSDNQTVSVIRNTENLLTLYNYCDMYGAGAAHGMYGETYIHFDPKTGAQVKFEDIFDRDAFYSGLKDKMIQQLFYDHGYEELYDYGGYLDEAFSGEYAADAYENGIGWLDRHWFYDNGTLTVSFDVYQLGSFAEGIKQAVFSYDEIKEYIIDESFFE